MLKTKTEDDEIRDLKHKTEKNDQENILKAHKIDYEYQKKEV